MRIALLAESGHPYAAGEGGVWCDRLVRGLADHEFEIYALESAPQPPGAPIEPPPHVRAVHLAPRHLARPFHATPQTYGRRGRERFAGHFTDLAAALSAPFSRDAPEAERFAAGLYGLAALGRADGAALRHALRSRGALRLLEAACRAPGSGRLVQEARPVDLLAAMDQLAAALRPLSLPWYGRGALADADLCHALSGGTAALPGLLARHFHGTPLLVTEYGVRLRRHYLAPDPAVPSAPARALGAGFERLLAGELCRRADLLTPGNAHARRWQRRLGAPAARQRTVYPGMEAERFAAVGEAKLPSALAGEETGGPDGTGGPGGPDRAVGGERAPEGQTLVWVGRIEPAKDVIALLHAFAEIRREEPGTRLLLVSQGGGGPRNTAYEAHCRALAAQLFPDEAAGAHEVGDNPVSFEEIGGPELPDPAAAYAAGEVLVLSSVVEGFPTGLVEGMFCGRASVSTDVGAVREVIGGTGLLVPPRNPRALADACLALLRDPSRRARLGAAARARALELFTVEQNTAAFRGIYLELISHRATPRTGAAHRPFARPAEAAVRGNWTAGHQGRGTVPRWSRPAEGVHREGPAAGPAAGTASYAGGGEAR
ncbi:DUF3492 domain-containing protein [Streptomyces polyrhachis]|uniref:D-inositol 3-phosphate glycosyltransferase n=1 Tax=Streptomyces polyrhachis TaxID=1282885 RepID=A0ABW2GL87_9ACTN